ADPRMADARPRQPRADAIAAIPVDAAGFYLPENPPRALGIGRVYAGGQAVVGVVHQVDRRLVVGDGLDADDRTEALVLHQGHRVVDVHQDRRLEPVALAAHDAAAGEELRAFLLRIGDLLLQHIELRTPRDRADVGRLVHRIAHLEALDLRHESGDERVVDRL